MAAIIIPIYMISTPMGALVLPWPVVLRMAVLQVLVSLATFDLLFYEWQQLPFTCSYVPGKRPLMMLAASWIAVLGAVAPLFTIVIAKVAQVPAILPIYGAFFAGCWIWARRRRLEGWGESRLIYEDLYGSLPSLGIKDATVRGVAGVEQMT